MYLNGKESGKVGRVSIDIKGKSYRLRFTYPENNRHEFSIARVSDEGWFTAIRAAQLINRDIDLGDFDETYARYSPKHARKLQIAQAEANKEYNLKELWEMYKEQNKDRIAETTPKKLWKPFERYLNEADKELMGLNKATDLMGYLLSQYSVSTLKPLIRTCLHPCVNQAVRQEKIKKNPYKDFKLPKSNKNPIECFEPDEIKEIIAAFYDDRFVSKSSRYKHSYYAPMVEFLALTGCRPEEVHALTWDDLKNRKDRVFIRFNKAYTDEISRPHTKTYEIRLFPCNNQLKELIGKIPRIENDNNLIFCSVQKDYVNQGNFRNRYWTRVVNGLVKQGKVEKYLKPYCLRHSFITRLIREGVDIKTVASLAGNSPKTIIDNYLASRKDFDLPEL